MENSNTEKEFIKLNFFKKIWYSIIKFEKYPEMASLGVKKAIIYFTELMLIFSIIITGAYCYYITNDVEYEQEDLTFSQKIITILINNEGIEDEESEKLVETVKDYPESTIIATLFLSFFMSFYLTTLLDVFILSLFGLLTCLIARIKINYKAVFNMSIYALTLSIILRLVYMILTILTSFEVKYFEIMYMAISYISLAAAIFLIKSDVIKQHLELMKIIEQGKEKFEETITIPKKPKEEDKDEDKDEENKGKEENKQEEEKGTEGQGSNA